MHYTPGISTHLLGASAAVSLSAVSRLMKVSNLISYLLDNTTPSYCIVANSGEQVH